MRKKKPTYAEELERMQERLLRCPFCGSKAEIAEKRGEYGYTVTTYGVSCVNRDCPAHGWDEYPTCKWETSEEAVSKWNTRTSQTEKEMNNNVKEQEKA